ncbi:hypothetical protein [Microseira wollei]|uniref:Uncharacterized protein n=1 Tax=Microseira wollei NIES-4236 TaxID=2530354 RepID=A0AAV3XEQ4_9CYAN|nr:hypothetical protein [Microseira wollei]GET40834.1 hypothetical protein MiSe_56460 [Microseira wollei NIES-4236]
MLPLSPVGVTTVRLGESKGRRAIGQGGYADRTQSRSPCGRIAPPNRTFKISLALRRVCHVGKTPASCNPHIHAQPDRGNRFPSPTPDPLNIFLV